MDPAAGVSFAGWPRHEVKLFLQTIGRFVVAQTKPLKDRIAELEMQIEELQARKFCGVHQRALPYRAQSQVTFDNGLWVAIADVEPGEVPAQSSKWQLAFRYTQAPRSPTKGGAREQHYEEHRT